HITIGVNDVEGGVVVTDQTGAGGLNLQAGLVSLSLGVVADGIQPVGGGDIGGIKVLGVGVVHEVHVIQNRLSLKDDHIGIIVVAISSVSGLSAGGHSVSAVDIGIQGQALGGVVVTDPGADLQVAVHLGNIVVHSLGGSVHSVIVNGGITASAQRIILQHQRVLAD